MTKAHVKFLEWLYFAVGISYVILINVLIVNQYFTEFTDVALIPSNFMEHILAISYVGGMIGATLVCILRRFFCKESCE